MIRTLSWGMGTQSTALAVMSILGDYDLPRLDAIISADTGWERQDTYEARDFYLDWFGRHDMDVHIVSAGDIRKDGAEEHIHIPFWTSDGGPLRRQCTVNFKIVPIKHKLRELLGLDPILPPNPPANAVEQWLGISYDEAERMKKSRLQYIRHRYPLVEKRLTRTDCIAYLRRHDLPVPVKSSCVCCPYRLASEWLNMKEEASDEFAAAVAFDEANRHNPLAERGGSTADELYLFKKAEPLRSADLPTYAARERQAKQLPLICDSGYCHV